MTITDPPLRRSPTAHDEPARATEALGNTPLRSSPSDLPVNWLAASTRAVMHSSNGGKPVHLFHWFEDGRLRTAFD
ncbi:DUF6461 domain-containing protein [Streptomyces sp. NBC_01800]|uniref:DUF6461 domain-containing protein n=1 Tax=Streptomyces sp. NBC_01800 TaxID=2975945 RepID=UPI003FA3AB98